MIEVAMLAEVGGMLAATGIMYIALAHQLQRLNRRLDNINARVSVLQERYDVAKLGHVDSVKEAVVKAVLIKLDQELRGIVGQAMLDAAVAAQQRANENANPGPGQITPLTALEREARRGSAGSFKVLPPDGQFPR